MSRVLCACVSVRARLCHQSAEIRRSLSPAMFTVPSTQKVTAFPIFLPACAGAVSRILFAERHLDSATIFRVSVALLFLPLASDVATISSQVGSRRPNPPPTHPQKDARGSARQLLLCGFKNQQRWRGRGLGRRINGLKAKIRSVKTHSGVSSSTPFFFFPPPPGMT